MKRQTNNNDTPAEGHVQMSLKDISNQNKVKDNEVSAVESEKLNWLKASYKFHTYAYRDPRSAFSTSVGLPVVSPTTLILGIASTLFRVGLANEAKSFLQIAHQCNVIVDSPEGVIFFRAFHQLRRYHTQYIGKDKKKGENPRIGMTNINQGTREYGLVDGAMTVYVAVPNDQIESVKTALTNLTHLGTHDSLCALEGEVEFSSPSQIIYMPSKEFATKISQNGLAILEKGVTIITLSCFKSAIQPVSQHWWLSGGDDDTELLSYTIPGRFDGTTRGKIYRKNESKDAD